MYYKLTLNKREWISLITVIFSNKRYYKFTVYLIIYKIDILCVKKIVRVKRYIKILWIDL